MNLKHLGFPPIDEVFFALCKSTDTPVSLGAWLRFKYNQLALAKMDINPRDYLDSLSFFKDYQCVSFLSKYKGLRTGLDLEEEAMKKFTSSEALCANTNKRFRAGRYLGFSKPIELVLHHARRKIASILGPFSIFALEPGFGWGPGATDDIRRRAAFVDTKMCKLPISCTRSALPLAVSVISNDLHWSSVLLGVNVEDLSGPFSFVHNEVFDLVDSCVIETVPKNAKTHRVIAKEPRLNAFLQKGVGSYIRKRLKREGIDLDDQSRNQLGAFHALTDRLATLDLQAASDTMSKEVIFDLLPIDWALCLDDLRSKKAILPDGSKLLLEKFSSMGNGFTFELETLVFYSLAYGVRKYQSVNSPILVYGDDIICSRKMSHMLINVLGFVGFKTNVEKTYTSGMFYESCGKHYFGGKDVTPAYQKEIVDSPQGSVRLANRCLRSAYRLAPLEDRDFYGPLVGAWLVERRRAIDRGDFFTFQIPFGTEGDEAYLSLADDWQTRHFDVNFGYRCTVMAQRQVSFPAHELALLAHSLRRGVVTESPYGGDVSASPGSLEGPPLKGVRWVMPTGEFGLSYTM